MEVLLNAAVPVPPRISEFITIKKHKFVKSRAVSCLRKNMDLNGLFTAPSQIELGGHDNMEMPQERFQSSNIESDSKQNDIWKIFTEAQQNILYLNKQRLMALEELNETKREKELLLQNIEQLKVEKQANPRKDKLSIGWELLLRIDSMVLTGVIGTEEASNLRKLVVDSKASVADVFSSIMHKRDAELLAELRQFSTISKKNGLHIVHISTEMEPVVSVGSLASYVTGLSRALQRKGNLVEVILPKYASLEVDKVEELREIEAEFYSYFNGQLHRNRAWTGVVYGIGVTFIQPLDYSPFFSREKIYGYSDDFERFTYFSRASLDYIVKSGKQPDVLHIHNWQTAIVGPLFWDIFVKQGLGGTRILLTCHGLDSQCLEQPDKVALCGLDSSRLFRSDRLQDNTKTHLVNILKGLSLMLAVIGADEKIEILFHKQLIKGGIVYANKVIIVSPIQSKERIIRSLSHGFESTLAIHKDKLLISPYGFDYSTWDPSEDKFLPKNYNADNMKGKAVCKVALQQRAGFSEHASTVLVGCIFSEISDVDLENLKAIIWIASKKGVQFIITGISKTPSTNRELESFQEELKDENVRIMKYDEALSHLLFAGSDIILCQSFHDPVLQVPFKALRYGAAPIAVNINDDRFWHIVDDGSESTKYSQYISTSFANMSINQALDKIMNDPLKWNQKMADAMAKDFSWDAECLDVHVSAYKSIKNL